MQLALYQPDIPQNLGAVLRLCACFGAKLHIIEPCGFPFDDKRIRRAGMDYIDRAEWQRHASWQAFQHYARERQAKLVLLTTKTDRAYYSVPYGKGDIFIAGRESAGVPPEVAEACELRVKIPMQPGARSLNLATSCAIALAEARRQMALV